MTTLRNPFPPCVKKIGICAPASSCDAGKLRESIRLIESFGIDIATGGNIFAGGSEKYLSAPDEARAADLNSLIADDSVDCIICSRGGYGSGRLLPLIDWKAFKKRKDLVLAGFSDITALHLAMLSKHAGVPVASQMAARFAETLRGRTTFNSMLRAYALAFSKDKPSHVLPFPGRLHTVRTGYAEGPVVPANLSVMMSLAGTGYMPSLEGAVLLLEDIGEPLRKIDRMLNQLLLSGIAGKAAAVVFGQFTDCESASGRNRLFADFADRAGCPVYSGARFGHELPSLSFIAGERVSVGE